MPDTVIWSGYLAISVAKRGHENLPGMWTTSAKISKGKPSVGRDEVAGPANA